MDNVIIIGGSFAGLAAALQLGRARLKVIVLDRLCAFKAVVKGV